MSDNHKDTNKVTIKINNREIKANAGDTVLQAATKAGIKIPSLCYLKDINEIAACRLCVAEVDINGRPMRGLPATCVLRVQEGMNVRTNTRRVRNAALQPRTHPRQPRHEPSYLCPQRHL